MRGIRMAMFFATAFICAALFFSGVSHSEEAAVAPADKPAVANAPKPYMIQPFDELVISVWPYEEMKMTAVVRPDGMVSYPFLGEVKVQGLTAGQLGEMITKSLEPYMKNPKVAVNVEGIRKEKATVLGSVRQPGSYDIRAGDTVMDLISRAGGFAENAKKSDVGLVRAPKEIVEKVVNGNNEDLPEKMVGILHHINVATLLGKAEFPAEYFVRNGDVIFVPNGDKPNWTEISSVISSILSVTRIDEAINLK